MPRAALRKIAPVLVSKEHAAELCDTGVTVIERLINEGKLPIKNLGDGELRVPYHALMLFAGSARWQVISE